MTALIEVDHLKTYFDTRSGTVRAVDDVSWTLEKGESLGLAGESGCGKTTTALSIIRLLPKNGRIVDGHIRYSGKDLATIKESELRRIRWKHIAIVFQGAMNALNPVKRVSWQIAEAIALHDNMSFDEAQGRVVELLELVGINPARKDEYPHEFSGGMRQRVMIAMALACRPKIIIADEPVTALDVMIQAQILELLTKLQKELDLSMILISHDLSVISHRATCGRHRTEGIDWYRFFGFEICGFGLTFGWVSSPASSEKRRSTFGPWTGFPSTCNAGRSFVWSGSRDAGRRPPGRRSSG